MRRVPFAGTTASVRVSYREKALLVEAAARRGVTLSEFVRRAALLDASVLDLVHSGRVAEPVERSAA